MTTQVFNTKAEDFYKSLQRSVDQAVLKYGISHLTTKQDLFQIKIKIFNDIWKWPKIEIDENPVDKNFEDLLLSRQEAIAMLGNHEISSMDPGVKATKAFYKFSFSGSTQALDLTVKYNPRSLPIERKGNQLTFAIFRQGDKKTIASQAITQKDAFLELVKANQKDLLEFAESKIESFNSWISMKVDSTFEAAVKKNDDRNLL